MTNAGRIRDALRKATLHNHERVDELFSHFSLDSPEGYAAFLRAHARAVAPLEDIARPEASRMPKLAEDLAVLGEVLPKPLKMENPGGGEAFRWGALYTLEGSRLGGAMLERRVAPGLPRAYLSAAHGKGGWAAFQNSLDAAAAAGGDDWIDDAIRGADAAFALFAEAAVSDRIHGHG